MGDKTQCYWIDMVQDGGHLLLIDGEGLVGTDWNWAGLVG